MNPNFPRILTLLRKEKNISQKNVAAQLGISQALLSHYEKGIRECGLDFLVRCADYYDVSCDYLLGRSPDRQGSTLTVEDIPEPDSAGRENTSIGTVLPVLNKKLIANSLNILFDLLAKAKSKSLTGEISSFLMLAVYRAFRVLYSANPKNQEALFNIPRHCAGTYADAGMQLSIGNAVSIAGGYKVAGLDGIDDAETLALSTELIGQNYPLFSSSLLNLIQNAENRIDFMQARREKK